MATTPATPAMGRAAKTPVTPAQGKMVFQLKKLARPLELDQDVIDPKWNRFKTYFGVWIGGLCFMAWVIFLAFMRGAKSVQQIPTPVAIQQPVTVAVPQPAPAPRELTPEERAEQFKEEIRRQYGVK